MTSQGVPSQNHVVLKLGGASEIPWSKRQTGGPGKDLAPGWFLSGCKELSVPHDPFPIMSPWIVMALEFAAPDLVQNFIFQVVGGGGWDGKLLQKPRETVLRFAEQMRVRVEARPTKEFPWASAHDTNSASGRSLGRMRAGHQSGFCV